MIELITSEKYNGLSDRAEILYCRLSLKADVNGRLPAAPKLINGNCFPLKNRGKDALRKHLIELADAGLIKLYTDNDKWFLEITDYPTGRTINTEIYPTPKEYVNLPAVSKKKAVKKSKPTFDDVKDYCKSKMLPLEDAKYLYHHWEANGWTVSGKPMISWKQTITSWIAAGYLPKNPEQYKREMEPIKKISGVGEPKDWRPIAAELYPMHKNIDCLNWATIPKDEQTIIINKMKDT